MANFNNIKHEIDQNVNTNGVQAITGAILNETLKDMLDDVDSQKQDTLVSGQNIKTINNQSLLGSGNITIQGGSGSDYYAGQGIDIDENNVISVDGADVAGRGLTSNGSQVDLDLSQVIGDGLDWSGDDPVLSVDASDLAGSGLTTDGNGNLAVDTTSIQQKLTAGANIQINGTTISATDTTYSAGSGILIDQNNEISADTSVLQPKLTAGSGISISAQNVISATGGGGGGTTYGDGDAISIDSNDNINVLYGNGLQLDGNGALEVDTAQVASDLAGSGLTTNNGQLEVDPFGMPFLPLAGGQLQDDPNNTNSTDLNITSPSSNAHIDVYTEDDVNPGEGTAYVEVQDSNGTAVYGSDGITINGDKLTFPLPAGPATLATDADLSSYLRNDASGTVQNFLDGTGDTELTVMDGMSEDYVRLGAYETQGEQPHIEIFENGSGDTKFFYDHIERGSQVSIDYPSTSGTLALTSDIPTVPTASSLAGNGLQDDGNGALEIDTTVVATQNDLSGYLPLTGGTLNNTGQINTNLSVQSPNSDYHVNTYVPNSGSVEIEIGMSSGQAVQNPSDGDVKNLRVYKDKVDLYTYDSGTSNWRADSLYFPKKKTGTIALDSDLAGKQDTLVSGTNIKTINGNSLLGSGDITISGGQSYTAGNGIDITSGTISVDASDLDGTGLTTTLGGELAVDTTVIQEKLTAGTGISISAQNVISATGGGATYTAGTGISIDANNQISAKIANGYGLGTNLNGELLVDAGALAGNGLQVDQNGQLEVVGGGGGSGLWTSGSGVDSLLSIPASTSNGTASGARALSAGWYTTASGDYSVALGNQTSATRTNAFAVGKQSDATGISSVALGDIAAASGDYSVALGSNPVASGTRSFATSNASASGTDAIAIGNGANASANLSVALGTSAKATNSYEIGLGKWNKSTSTGTDADKTQFTVGNGTALGSELNIIEAKKNNDVYLYGVGNYDGTNAGASGVETLQDVINNAGGGGTSYTAGTGINIDAQNVISNSAPSKWVVGSGTNSLAAPGLLYTRAGGNNALAICNGRADGNYSLGCGGRANSQYSIALGLDSDAGISSAIGENSIAIGRGTITQRNEETALGYYNYSNNSNTASLGTSFSIGAGGSSINRSNVLEFKDNKDLYIYGIGGFTGTNGGSAGINSLQVVLNGKQDTLTAGTGISISGNVISATGGGGGGLWTSGTGTDSLVAPGTVTAGLAVDPAQGTGAISCGYDTNADGDYAFASGGTGNASGDYSFAANNGTASGDYSAAFGTSGAYGDRSFAAGNGSIAGASYSIALAGGNTIYDDTDPNNIIDAEGSVAIGNGAATNAYQAIAIGSSANTSDIAIDGIAIGVAAYANAQEATAIGSSSTAEGIGTVALSSGIASGERSTAMSSGSAAGDYSIAGGLGAIAGSYSSVALGFNTMTYDQGDPTDPSEANAGEAAFGRYNYTEQDFIFSVGCGQEIYHDPDDPDFEPNPEDPDSPDGWYEIIRQNAIAITSDGSIYIKGAGGYLGQGIAGADSLQTLLYNLNPQ